MVDVCALAPGNTEEYLRQYRNTVAPVLRRRGALPLAPLRSLQAVNTFPRLPVRQDIHVAVTLANFADRAAGEQLLTDLDYVAASGGLDRFATTATQRLRLTPTPRSALR